MATVYRSEVIDLLERLGARSDEDVLKSARDLHEMVAGAGISWTDLVRPDLEFDSDHVSRADDGDPDDGDPDDGDPDDSDPDDGDSEPELSPPAAQAGPRVAADPGDDRKILDRLLASKTISSKLRQEIKDLKRDLDDDEFTAMDSDYIRALAERLNVRVRG